jgi:hypothetical protein
VLIIKAFCPVLMFTTHRHSGEMYSESRCCSLLATAETKMVDFLLSDLCQQASSLLELAVNVPVKH